ncbi:MAG: 3-octaprenyl-4-hydroxybenzoate carboxy-lyase [Methanosaeta sp. PtaB.Bin039]|nr:MAG: 3-octaprenyl-4-hydroxybenzoate carboxy-lyase [Methanosaeta sp. PtaB.Bin039]OPY44607.1 MAG: 3-octaprenyl-4-hydroxybenzoate carboxy-lyase [Methanosaeta sp. PtaU1.Bin028]HOT06405.1 UbiX family flavin prenyltransferase [Methanotrichaceae archaeon]HQI90912.1 UbiX family flavin prenyltransferase [Methanotrichaceae archaeon]HQJ28334.1 UbiX family flavin prenyltransferase [Methanotrichaceae archaeon]
MSSGTPEIVVGLSGASGIQYGIRILQELSGRSKTHLIMTRSAREILSVETDWRPDEVEALAFRSYNPEDFTAPFASGSYRVQGMVVAPCSMRTLAGIASGFSDTLITRAADVCLKEHRRLVLVTREAPLNLIHLRNMVQVAEAGGVIMPACPAFYGRPHSVEDLVDTVAGRALDLLGVKQEIYRRWGGPAGMGKTYNDSDKDRSR